MIRLGVGAAPSIATISAATPRGPSQVAASILFNATVGDNTLHLRAQVAGFDCVVDWGDGTKSTVPADGGNLIHDYATAGEKTINITGESFAGFYVNNQVGKEKYLGLYSLGEWATPTMTTAFRMMTGCTALRFIAPDALKYATEVTTFRDAFDGCTDPEFIGLPDDLFRYNVLVTNFSATFKGCTSLRTVPSDMFQYNTLATVFSQTFRETYSLVLSADIFGTDVNRYAARDMNFFYTFARYTQAYTGTGLGVAPALWTYAYASITNSSCFAGNETMVSNYDDIHHTWK